MPLHPEVEAMRARKAREGTAPLYTLSLADARAADLADIQAAGGTGEPVGAVTERTIAGPGGPLRIRMYEPRLSDEDHDDAGEVDGDDAGTVGAKPGRPALIYLFGGGWTLGNLETCHAIRRA